MLRASRGVNKQGYKFLDLTNRIERYPRGVWRIDVAMCGGSVSQIEETAYCIDERYSPAFPNEGF